MFLRGSVSGSSIVFCLFNHHELLVDIEAAVVFFIEQLLSIGIELLIDDVLHQFSALPFELLDGLMGDVSAVLGQAVGALANRVLASRCFELFLCHTFLVAVRRELSLQGR
jgi:hypothetical protein